MSPLLPAGINRVLVTESVGFISGALVRHLLVESTAMASNRDKCGSRCDLTNIFSDPRNQLLRAGLTNGEATAWTMRAADPDLVLHLD